MILRSDGWLARFRCSFLVEDIGGAVGRLCAGATDPLAYGGTGARNTGGRCSGAGIRRLTISGVRRRSTLRSALCVLPRSGSRYRSRWRSYPTRSVLADSSPAFIYAAMTTGVMQPMSSDLNEQEKRSIALYVSPIKGARGSAGDPDVEAIWGRPSTQMPLDGPNCEHPPPPVDLATPDQWNGWGPDHDNDRFQTHARAYREGRAEA
jgi:hypothetical protein